MAKSKRFEYLILTVQTARVTFANGEWQGGGENGNGDAQTEIDSCPLHWDYLQYAGDEGWELVGAIPQDEPATELQTLYMKRKVE